MEEIRDLPRQSWLDGIELESSTVLYADKLDDYDPQYKRKATAREISLLKFTLGHRVCSDSFVDKLLNYYLLAIIGVILFIILSLDWVDRCMCQFTTNKYQRLIFKAAIIFIVLYLLDRWLEIWRKSTRICRTGCIN